MLQKSCEINWLFPNAAIWILLLLRRLSCFRRMVCIQLAFVDFVMGESERGQSLKENDGGLARLVLRKRKILLSDEVERLAHERQRVQMAVERIHLHSFDDIHGGLDDEKFAGTFQRVPVQIGVVDSDFHSLCSSFVAATFALLRPCRGSNFYDLQPDAGLMLSSQHTPKLCLCGHIVLWDARAMAVHAAMIDRVDQGIGQIIEALKKTGQLDNTLILFLSDNGCSNEDCQNMSGGENDRPDMTRDGKKIIYPRNKQVLPGPQTTYASLGARWSNVANTPFRFWKAKSYEGGICTPMIAHWPKGIKKNVGGMTSEIGHVMDIMATCVDLADAEYPATYKGHDILPMEGKSLLPIFKTGHRKGHDYLGFEHFNERAFLSNDGWKLVRPKNNSQWELYNLNEDRSEQHDLAAKYPEKVAEMSKAYEAWAKRCMVEPYPGQKKK